MRKGPTVAGCLMVQPCVGILYLWSVFNAHVVDHYSWTVAAANMVSSIMVLGFVLGNLVGGAMQDRMDPKGVIVLGCCLFSGGVLLTSFLTPATIGLFYLTYCVLGGLGSGIVYGCVISVMQKLMPERRGFASGLAVSAFGLSTVVFGPLSNWLLGRMPVPDTFRTLAIVFFAVSLVACAMIRVPPRQDTGAAGAAPAERSIPLSKAIKTVPFWCIFFVIFFMSGTWSLAVPLLKRVGMERGLSEGLAIFMISITGVTNAMGRLGMASLSDKLGRVGTLYILAVLSLGGAVLMLFVGGYAFIVVVAVIAFAYGGPSAVNPALTTDFFGAKYSGTNYGVIMLSLGLSSVCFNWIAGSLLDGDVTMSFIMGAVTAAVSMVFIAVIGRQSKNWDAKKAAILG